MSRLSLFNSPLLLGFDHFERTLDRVAKAGAEGYPPYNIEQVGEAGLRITLAVAGFTNEDLSIQIESKSASDGDCVDIAINNGAACAPCDVVIASTKGLLEPRT